MSDIKRIQLTTISDVKKNSSDLNILSPSSSPSNKATRYEINVDLFEPNAKSFPEFNYKKLLHAVKKKQKKNIKSPPNGLTADPFEDNDDDVERIAREFERKYGGVNNNYSGGGKKSNRPKITSDLCDKGAGYDDNDSFIDNTEAYDELIPEEVDTVSGGFYINSGALEFKHLSNYERPEDAHKMPKPRKRILSTSSSSSGSSDENDNDPDENNHESDAVDNNLTVTSKPKNNGHSDKKIKVLNVSTSDEEKQAKQTPPLAKPLTKDKEKKVKKDKKDEVLNNNSTGNNNCNNNDNNSGVNSNTNANNSSSNNNNVSNSASSERDKQIKTTTVKDMLRAKRDSILGLKENAVKGDNEVNDEESTNSSLSSSSSNEQQQQQQQQQQQLLLPPQPITVGNNTIAAPTVSKSVHINAKDANDSKGVTGKLPANISAELLKSIEELKEISLKHTQSGAKTNFFDTKTMDVIMKIDTETRNGDSATRTSVFQHIEQLVPFTQKTIMGHIRKVRVQNEENKLTKYYNKLKSAVDLVLPIATESYKEECQKVNQIRSTMPNDDKISTNAPKMPRKRFPWNDNTRKLLFDLYTALKLSYNIVKPRKETVDSFIENYFKTKLIGLWPPGWMRLEELNKEIERRKVGIKKPKENKKPAEMAGNQLNSVNSTISTNNNISNSNNNQTAPVPNQSNMVVDTVNVTTKEANNNNNNSKSILSTNNAFATKVTASQSSVGNTIADKSNTTAISSSNSNQIYSKTDKTESNYDINKKSSSGNTSNQASNASTINLTNSLTITPVKTTGSASSTSKPLPSVENKVTITNVDTLTTPNSTNHHSSNMSSVLKPDILKSSKQSLSSNNSSLGNKPISSTKQSSSNVISISPAGSTVNASSMQPPTASTVPVRKTSDYSINSIMSTATSSSTTGSNSLNLNLGHSNSYTGSKTPSSSVVTSPFSVNEICSINNKVNETIENSIKSKSDSNSNNHHNINNSNSNHNNNNSLAHKDSVIKVRSVANMNSSIRENTSSSRTLSGSQATSLIQPSSATSVASLNTKKIKKTVHNSDDDYDDDSDSSDVEIVDVFQPKRSKTKRDSDIEIVEYKPQTYTQQQRQKNKNIMINKHKYNKNNYVEPKINNYVSNSNQKLAGPLAGKKEDSSNMNKLNHQSTIDNDLDVSQIMKDLKELQELQQPKCSAMHALDNSLALSKQNQHATSYGKSLKDTADKNILMSQYLP